MLDTATAQTLAGDAITTLDINDAPTCATELLFNTTSLRNFHSLSLLRSEALPHHLATFPGEICLLLATLRKTSTGYKNRPSCAPLLREQLRARTLSTEIYPFTGQSVVCGLPIDVATQNSKDIRRYRRSVYLLVCPT